MPVAMCRDNWVYHRPIRASRQGVGPKPGPQSRCGHKHTIEHGRRSVAVLVPALRFAGRRGVAGQEGGGGAAGRGFEASGAGRAHGGLGLAATIACAALRQRLPISPCQWVGGQAGHPAGACVGRCVCPKFAASSSNMRCRTSVTDRQPHVGARPDVPAREPWARDTSFGPVVGHPISLLRPAPGLKEPAQAHLEKQATTLHVAPRRAVTRPGAES